MTATETTIAPPAFYPAADWLGRRQDLLLRARAYLRGSTPPTSPPPPASNEKRLHEVNYAGRATVDEVIVDPATGRHRLADPVDRGDAASRDCSHGGVNPKTRSTPTTPAAWRSRSGSTGIRYANHATRSAAAAEAMIGHRGPPATLRHLRHHHLRPHVVYGVYTRGGTFCGRTSKPSTWPAPNVTWPNTGTRSTPGHDQLTERRLGLIFPANQR